MGGSLGLAARERVGAEEVRGFSQTRATLDLALERGAVTIACDTLEEACAGADLIFVCTPVRLVVKYVREALRAAEPHAVVTDVGSTKGPLMRALSPTEQRRCIGGHPLCGSETAGVANARASLYQGATYFVTPGAHVDADAYQLLYGFLGEIGARPVAVDPEEHDRVMAVVSHLPHVLANVLMSQAGQHAGARDALLSAGPSFRDLTRIAGSNRRASATPSCVPGSSGSGCSPPASSRLRSCIASSSRCRTDRVCSARSWSPSATPASTWRIWPCTT